jgi:TonB family protein
MLSRDSIRKICGLAFCGLLFCSLPRTVSSQESAELKPLKKVVPAYPDVLKKMGVSGAVHLRVTLAADGSVKNVEVHGGSAILADAASKAVSQWHYAAGAKDRVAEVTVEFECCNTVKTTP